MVIEYLNPFLKGKQLIPSFLPSFPPTAMSTSLSTFLLLLPHSTPEIYFKDELVLESHTPYLPPTILAEVE